MERTNAWNTYDPGEQRSCMDFADDYKDFLSQCKTERECIDRFVNEAEAGADHFRTLVIGEVYHITGHDCIQRLDEQIHCPF